MARPKKDKNSGILNYKGFLERADSERLEIIDGVACPLLPPPGKIHQKILLALAVKFFSFLGKKEADMYISPFHVRLPKEGEDTAEKISTVVRPDISVVCDSKRVDDLGIVGAPDLIIEIVSPSSASQDYIRKLALYERHKVREYWIVHPGDKIVMVYKIREDGTYGKSEIYSEIDVTKVGIFSSLPINLREIFGSEI
ncbi:Uma2 family endonuclease [bacterium]|nr:Uma2 family endonuclease [bacterium]